MVPANWADFVTAYNDTKKFPTMADIGVELGLSYQTVRNKAAIYRAMASRNKDYTLLVDRYAASNGRAQAKTKTPNLPPEDHARIRAENLSQDVTDLVTGSKYPLINPEALQIESAMIRRYDRQSRSYELVEGKPHTWVTETLKVKAIEKYKGRKFIFSSAQNDCEIHPILANLEAYAADIGAELIIGPLTYETQWWKENDPSARSYADELKEYLCFGQLKIGPDFIFAGEMNTLPTASKPITDLVTYARGRWGVFPHPKRQLKSVPSTDPTIQARQVLTTGSVTYPKVIPRKAGVKSIFHHVAGAVIVEFDKEGDVFCRHISADESGSFYDFDAYVSNETVIRGQHRAKVISMPDTHRAKMGVKNAGVLFGIDILTGKKVKGSLVDALNPELVTIQDIFDHETRNHHHAKDPLHNYEQAVRGRDKIITELEELGDFLVKIQRPNTTYVVIEGNHDIALERYIREGRFRMDGANMRLGNDLERVLLDRHDEIAKCRDAQKPVPSFSLMEHTLRRLRGKLIEGVKWARDGSSMIIDGIEHGHHGFRGANGAKGTVSGFARLGKKMTIGDKHSPEIDEGVYVNGAQDLHHGYNKGPSGWAVTVTVQYPDGKRTLITLQNGKYRG